MTPSSIQSRAEAAAERLWERSCDHFPIVNGVGLHATRCRTCIAAVIAEEIRASEERVEALKVRGEKWEEYARLLDYDMRRGVTDKTCVATVKALLAAEAADARARELGALP